MKNNSLWSDAIYRLTRNKAAMFGGMERSLQRDHFKSA